MKDKEDLIVLSNVSKIYGEYQNQTKALDKINLNIKKGELIVVLGHSGSGKSTLLNMIGGLDQPTSGQIFFNGQCIPSLKSKQISQYRRDHIGFVFQSYNLIQDLTAYENVELALGRHKQSMSVDNALDIVGLAAKKTMYPSQMSGGEQQRVAIARGIVKKADVLLFDEPTGALDDQTSKQVLQIIESLRDEYHQTMIIVTHNEEISKLAHRVVMMRNGQIVEIKVNSHPLKVSDLKW